MRREDDEGSASIWVLAVSMAVLAMTYAALLVCAAVGARHRAEAAADLAALAGAAAVQRGGDGCAAAAAVAGANVARLSRCTVAVDGSVTVATTVAVPPGLLRWASGPVEATARAGS